MATVTSTGRLATRAAATGSGTAKLGSSVLVSQSYTYVNGTNNVGLRQTVAYVDGVASDSAAFHVGAQRTG
jgi:hypothetical protein